MFSGWAACWSRKKKNLLLSGVLVGAFLLAWTYLRSSLLKFSVEFSQVILGFLSKPTCGLVKIVRKKVSLSESKKIEDLSFLPKKLIDWFLSLVGILNYSGSFLIYLQLEF